MGPRSHERGNLGAGIFLEDSETLQWGRVLMNAETAPGAAATSSNVMLQWGRVLMNAETRTILAKRQRAGAELQWGRVLMNAETPGAFAPETKVLVASMGPRSHERGNARNAEP